MKKIKLKENVSERNAFGIVLAGFIIILGVAIFSAVCFGLLMRKISVVDDSEYIEYEKQYAFITDNTEKEFWNEVYDAAEKEGEENGIYIERLADNLSINYSTKDILRMAINSSVDGIIFCGESNKETIGLINRAVQKGIAVVCLRRDIDESDRQCFVGVNSYDLGLEYGKQIDEIVQTEKIDHPYICILMDDSTPESTQNLITLAIRDSFSEKEEEKLPDIELIGIDTSDAFSAEETIRDILIDEKNLPDIMVCLNSIYTQCAYQAAVDYNRVGDIKILGYFSTEAILDAVEKQIIYSTMKVDTKEMGVQSVRALAEYNETGYASSYIPVKTWVIEKEEAGRLLREAEENAAE